MNISETFSTDAIYFFEQGLISSNTLMTEFNIDYEGELKRMKEEELWYMREKVYSQQKFRDEYLNQWNADTSNQYFSEKDLSKVQRGLKEIDADTDMTFGEDEQDYVDAITLSCAEIAIGGDHKFSRSKKGNNNNNSEYVGGVFKQTLEDNSNTIFGYNDVINYFEGRYKDEQRN